MRDPLVVGLSLAASVFFAMSTALRHRSATTISLGTGRSGARRVARFLHSTVRHRWWQSGLLTDAAGLGLQAAALHIGAVSVVQPVLVSAVLLSMVFTHMAARTRISREELIFGAVLVLALASFVVAAGNPDATAQGADRGVAVLAGVLAAALALGCVALARGLEHGGRAAAIGVAVGTSYACSAVLLKGVTNIFADHGALAVVTSWQLPLLVVSGLCGMALSQLAFRAGPLNASLPAIATVDPLASVALGLSVYDEKLRSGAGPVTVQLLSLAALALAAVILSRVAADSQGMRDAGRDEREGHGSQAAHG